MTTPFTLADIRTKVRRITGRPSANQITNAQIDQYINTFYQYDFPEHLRLQNLKVNYQFTTSANIPAYDFPRNLYLTNMPPVYIGGYESYMTQSRENFFRINNNLKFLEESVATGNGGSSYSGTLINTPILPGFKPNPPGAYSDSTASDVEAQFLNWNVMFSAEIAANARSGIARSVRLVDDGQGNLFSPDQLTTDPASRAGTINYITGAFSITNFLDSSLNAVAIPTGNPINAQYTPYVASRPQSVVFYQDQFLLYPVPDQAYTVSFEAYKQPTAFLDTDVNGTSEPQLREWWQVLALGAATKIFEDNADFENLSNYRPLLEEQLRLVQRRTIVQQTAERTATIYSEQSQLFQYPFGNNFSGF